MIRFFLLLILFIASLLCLFKAPEYHWWLLAIAVTCYPLVFAGITAVVTATGFWVQKWQFAGTILGILAVIFYLSPIVRAYRIAGNIKQDMSKAFSGLNGSSGLVFPAGKQPFSFADLLKSAKNVPCKTVTYVTYKDTSLTMDFYPSQLPGDRPCIINVHGGSWEGGDNKQIPEINSYLAQKGYNVAAINYRLAPKWQTPAPVEDVKSCMAYCREHAAELHIDSSKFVILGRSAGSQIALLAAYTIKDPAIKGVIDFYGPSDMVWGYSIPSNPLIMNSRKVMNEYVGGTYSQVPEKFHASSPVEFVDKNSVPTLIIHGNNDVWVSPEHCRRLIRKLQPNHVKYYWLLIPWATHGFDYNLYGPGGQLSTYAVETFINTVTK